MNQLRNPFLISTKVLIKVTRGKINYQFSKIFLFLEKTGMNRVYYSAYNG